MAPCSAPACSPALPVKPQGVWARGSEAWAGSRDRRNLEFVRWGSSGPSSLMWEPRMASTAHVLMWLGAFVTYTWLMCPKLTQYQTHKHYIAGSTKPWSPSASYTPRNEVRGGYIYTPATKLGGYIGFSLSVCPSVCLSVNLSCPPCSIYSSGWILSIFGTNDH